MNLGNYLYRFSGKKIIIALVFFLLPWFLSAAANSHIVGKQNIINLAENTWYIKAGFAQDDKMGTFRSLNGVQPVREFPIHLNKVMDYPDSAGIRHFALVAEFTWNEQLTVNVPRPALFMSGIGENWELFLNGEKIVDFLDEEAVRGDKYRKNVIIPLPMELIRESNYLVFHIAGYKNVVPFINNKVFGFPFSDNYYIGNESDLREANSQSLLYVLIGIYLFFGFYSIFFYLRYRPSRYNLFFGLFSIFMATYLAIFTNSAFESIPDSRWIIFVRYITQPSLTFLFLLFIFDYFGEMQKFKKIIISSAALNGFISVLLIFMPYKFSHSILVFWYILALPQFIYIVYYIIRKTFLKEKHAGILASTIGFALVAAIWDMVDAVFFSTGLRFLEVGLFLFILSMTALLSNRFVDLQRETIFLNKNLGEKNMELDMANMQIRASEEKYRHLVESFQELIFIMNEKFEFITVNKASMKILGIRPKDMEGLPFVSLTPKPKDESIEVQRHLLKEIFDDLMKTKKNAQFKVIFENKFTGEPKELNVILQYIQHEDRVEILGRASENIEDILVDSFIAEKSTYKIKNYLTQADNISQRVTQNLSKYMDIPDAQEIRISVREMIINAIEHGNLGITFDEKTQAMMEEKLFDLVKSRQEDPAYGNRKVTVGSLLTSKKFGVYIEDQGDGFNHLAFLKKTPGTDSDLSHGRGIMMARSVFNKIQYNKKGNAVTLIKYLGKETKP